MVQYIHASAYRGPTLHLTAAKRVLRYLKGTINMGLHYGTGSEIGKGGDPVGYSDADWAGSLEDRHSTTGNLFTYHGAAVTWASKKQGVIALSTTEAEYATLSAAAQEAVWLRRLLADLGVEPKAPTVLMEDNQGTIALALNPVFHGRTKHIDIRHHYIRERIGDGTVALQYCPTKEMSADILTKPLTRGVFEGLRDRLRVSDGKKKPD